MVDEAGEAGRIFFRKFEGQLGQIRTKLWNFFPRQKSYLGNGSASPVSHGVPVHNHSLDQSWEICRFRVCIYFHV